MYLSCIELDPDQSDARRCMSNAYLVHQLLLKAWPDGEAGRVLYRLELERRPPRLLVQSAAAADWARCFAGTAIPLEMPRQKRLEIELAPGKLLRFFLRANPTVRRLDLEREGRPPEGLISGERVGLLREAEQVGWLTRKAAAAGFTVVSAEARDRGDQVSYRAAARQRLVHRCVDFEGRLRVTDPEAMLAAMRGGIGPAKAFGFGLLSLAAAGGP